MKLYDAVVIGGGPAGVTAALYLVRAGISTAMIERVAVGGQVLSTSEVENYPAFPKGIKGWELADLFSAHLDPYAVDRLRGDVTALEPGAGPNGAHIVRFSDKDPLAAKTVVICSGATHRKLGAPGEDKLAGKGVSYCAVCDGNFYRGRDVAVVGGGNSALEESLYLARIVNKVYLIHRRDAFRGAKVYEDKIATMTDKIELVLSTVVDEMRGDDNLQELAVRRVDTGETRIIPVEGVFLYVGMQANGEFLPQELQRDSSGFVITDAEMVTNIPGIFAAGDIRAKHCRQISSAVGDGATAATAALSHLEQFDA